MITGARGYVGTALAERLSGEGHRLRLVSRASREPVTILPQKQVEYVAADLRSADAWLSLLAEVDAVVHLSWRTDLHAAEASPREDRELNVEPVRALVRAARDLRRALPVIFASTVTIVGPTPQIPVNDTTEDQPCSVYDQHKLDCETMLLEATRAGVLRACSLRLSNVYGYGSGVVSINSNRGILNAAMRRAAQGGTLTLYGNGEYVRDFTFIGDVVDAVCRALGSAQALNGGHYVVACGQGYTLAQAFQLVAQEALRCAGRTVELRNVPEPPNLHPIERRNFVGDSSGFQELTGWRPQVDLPSGIRDYFERILVRSRTSGTPHEAA
jgi:nucleoside-diphosphate-sugar epimerase